MIRSFLKFQRCLPNLRSRPVHKCCYTPSMRTAIKTHDQNTLSAHTIKTHIKYLRIQSLSLPRTSLRLSVITRQALGLFKTVAPIKLILLQGPGPILNKGPCCFRSQWLMKKCRVNYVSMIDGWKSQESVLVKSHIRNE